LIIKIKKHHPPQQCNDLSYLKTYLKEIFKRDDFHPRLKPSSKNLSKVLFSRTISSSYTPLHVACRDNKPEAIKAILSSLHDNNPSLFLKDRN